MPATPATPARLFVILSTGEKARVVTELKLAPDGAPSVAVTVVDGVCPGRTREVPIPRSSQLATLAYLADKAMAGR